MLSSKLKASAASSLLLWPVMTTAQSHDLRQEAGAPNNLIQQQGAKLRFLDEQAAAAQVPMHFRQAALAIYRDDVLWKKSTIKVCFWNGTSNLQNDIMKLANVWHEAVPRIVFDYVENRQVRICKVSDLKDYERLSDIRITLDSHDSRPLWNKDDVPEKQSDWSHYGTEVAELASYPVTMSLVQAPTMSQSKNIRVSFSR